jgi:ABC-2 type transport system permease protein
METLELARYPSFAVPTLLFPALFFLAFVVPRADESEASWLMATFIAFAFLGVAFFQFGVGIAVERTSSWTVFLRTLPAPASVHLAGRVLSALVFAFASGLVVVAVATPLTEARLSAAEWAALAGALLAGAVPFALLGIALGYLAPPKGALPIANVLYLALAYLGGLWTGPDQLPGGVEAVSRALPTRQYADVVTAAALGRPPPLAAWLALAGWTAGLAALAAWAYRRDEGVRYR